MNVTLFAITFFFLCTFAPAQSTEGLVTADGKSLYTRVNGVNINYLDWGGMGSPLVMIHGLGDSPHIFDDLAPLLCDRFHVYAYARRGHGQSDSPDGPYDLATLVEDLRQLLDKLGLKRTSLLGWSMGGNEITQFAGLYPDRVEKLIYLEGGYEIADPEFLEAFEATIAALGPDASALLSLDAFRDWYHTAVLGKDTAWTPGLDNYLRDITHVDAEGKVKVVPNEKAYMKLFASLASPPRDYTKVKAPSLVLYASEFFPPEPGNPAIDQKVRDFEQKAVLFRKAQMERIQRQLKNASIKQIPDRTHMSIGIRSPDALAATIRDFLLAKPTR